MPAWEFKGTPNRVIFRKLTAKALAETCPIPKQGPYVIRFDDGYFGPGKPVNYCLFFLDGVWINDWPVIS